MRHLISFIFLILFLAGCKNDNTSGGEVSQADLLIKPDNAVPTDPEKLTIPNACEMITEANIQSILNVAGSPVTVKEANDPSNNKAKSCFFKWDDASTPNAGILIQIQTNPVYNDFPQYISNYVSAKITEGETVLGNDKPTKFKKFTAGGYTGAYSFEQSRFYWNIGNDYLFMLAFNLTSLNENQMVDVAAKIIVEINNNFKSKIKQ